MLFYKKCGIIRIVKKIKNKAKKYKKKGQKILKNPFQVFPH